MRKSSTYQAFYGLKHYNPLETGTFLIRKLNQLISYLVEPLYFSDEKSITVEK